MATYPYIPAGFTQKRRVQATKSAKTQVQTLVTVQGSRASHW
jgi:hypothetical protein